MTIDTDPSTQQHTIVVVCIVSPIVSSLFVAMRLWTRAFVTHSLGKDDCKLPRLCFLDALPSHVIRYCFSYFGEHWTLAPLSWRPTQF